MITTRDLYDKYDLLLPPRFDGGYLVISLDAKIKNGDIEEPFTHQQIEETLTEISTQFEQESVRQWGRIKDNLLHYLIRNYPDNPGKYYLTDYAYSIIEMMQNKLDNPYKQHPLKKSFELSFYLKATEITCIEDLERKFGRDFIRAPKKIVTDHLAALEDELQEAYKTLNTILSNEQQQAVDLVNKFAITFKRFGSRAEDITAAMASKEKFVRDIQQVVDSFYARVEAAKYGSDNETKVKVIKDWEKAKEIAQDLLEFFRSVEHKISTVRRQINNASEKLSELQEYFSSRANYRLRIQKLMEVVLQMARYTEEGVEFEPRFPLKAIAIERVRMLHLRHNDFDIRTETPVIQILPDSQYELVEMGKIENEINRQLLVANWINIAKEKLRQQKKISVDELMVEVLNNQHDLTIAYQVAAEIVCFASEDKELHVEVKQEPVQLELNEMILWKIKVKK